MVTTVNKTIGSSGADYSTLQAWEDAAPSNLVTADQIWRGLLKNETFSYAGSGAMLTIGGSTTDSTRYKELTCDTGASFKDNAGKLTNALRANASNGALITSNTTNYANALIVATEANNRLTGLQISVTNAQTGKCLLGGHLYDCIIESAGSNATDNTSVARQVFSARNCLFVSRRSGVTSIVGHGTGTPTYWNCTFVVPSDLTAATYAVSTNYTCTRTFRNCAFFGCTNVIQSTSGSTFTTCRTSSSQSISDVTQIAYDTSTGSGFENTTDSTRDFRIKSTSALIDVGTTYSTDAPADIVGTTRPQGSSYDIGCWEYGTSTTPITSDLSQTFTISASLTSDLAETYSIIQGIEGDLGQTYSLLGAATSDLACTYTVINAAQADLAETYTVISEVQSDLPQTFTLINEVQNDLSQTFALINEVQSDLSQTYTVINAVQSDLSQTYTVINAAQADLAETYAINGEVTSDLAETYTVINAVSGDLSQTYAINGTVSSDLAETYVINGTVSSDLSQTYDVENEAVVISDLSQTYTVISSIVSDLAQTFSIADTASSDLGCAYSVINAVQGDLAQTFTLLGAAQADLSQTFDVLGTASSDLAQAYLLVDSVSSDLSCSYNVFASGGGTGASVEEIWQHVVEGDLSAEECLRIILAAVTGRTTGIGSNQERYLSVNGTKPRVTADFDGNNNRVAVVLDGS